MRVEHLFENRDRALAMRRAALNLQQLMEDKHLGAIIDDVELSNSSIKRSTGNVFEIIVLKLTGPLVEFYLDITYDGGGDYILQARTDRDVPGDGILITDSSPNLQSSTMIEWFNADRVTRYLTNPNFLVNKNTAMYNYLWLDKIAKSLPSGYNFFLKNLRAGAHEVCTSQILAPGIDEDDWSPKKKDRFHITFVKDEQGLGFTVNTFDAVNAAQRISSLDELHKFLKDNT